METYIYQLLPFLKKGYQNSQVRLKIKIYKYFVSWASYLAEIFPQEINIYPKGLIRAKLAFK